MEVETQGGRGNHVQPVTGVRQAGRQGQGTDGAEEVRRVNEALSMAMVRARCWMGIHVNVV